MSNLVVNDHNDKIFELNECIKKLEKRIEILIQENALLANGNISCDKNDLNDDEKFVRHTSEEYENSSLESNFKYCSKRLERCSIIVSDTIKHLENQVIQYPDTLKSEMDNIDINVDSLKTFKVLKSKSSCCDDISLEEHVISSRIDENSFNEDVIIGSLGHDRICHNGNGYVIKELSTASVKNDQNCDHNEICESYKQLRCESLSSDNYTEISTNSSVDDEKQIRCLSITSDACTDISRSTNTTFDTTNEVSKHDFDIEHVINELIESRFKYATLHHELDAYKYENTKLKKYISKLTLRRNQNQPDKFKENAKKVVDSLHLAKSKMLNIHLFDNKSVSNSIFPNKSKT